jgi:hypothetical protein
VNATRAEGARIRRLNRPAYDILMAGFAAFVLKLQGQMG